MKSNTANHPNQFARSLRKHQTDAENQLWYHLRDRRFSGYKFRRQHPIGPFIADFCCPDRNLVIEIDGGQHASLVEADCERTAYLESRGFVVLRFWSNQVLKEFDAVLETILSALQGKPPHPDPLPQRERGVMKNASRLRQEMESYPSQPLREKEQDGFTLFEVMVTVVLASIMMTGAFYFFDDFSRAWNQDTSDIELQRQGTYALAVMEASIRECDRFTISDFGTGTDNQITVTVANPTGGTRTINYCQNGTAIDETDAQTITIIPDTHVQQGFEIEVTSLTFTDETIAGQPGQSVRIDLALQDASGQTAAFTASARLRNQDVE